ncbi:hypothetical protein R1flu_007509 [Riccia fluitans]|uniref:Uncharacterized protein n=1 Tax=Riccia fluitans TaxID=41844 RepID=A0ABD1YZB6_9MARC
MAVADDERRDWNWTRRVQIHFLSSSSRSFPHIPTGGRSGLDFGRLPSGSSLSWAWRERSERQEFIQVMSPPADINPGLRSRRLRATRALDLPVQDPESSWAVGGQRFLRVLSVTIPTRGWRYLNLAVAGCQALVVAAAAWGTALRSADWPN